VHRRVLGTTKYAGLTKKEQLYTSVGLLTGDFDVNDIKHIPDPELCKESQAKIKVWAHMMTQYNLKPGLRKFGAHGLEELYLR
jgi:hypothetical protein